MQWSYNVGPSAGAGSSQSRLLAHNVSLAQCVAACERAGETCAAVDFVQRHTSSKVPATSISKRTPQCTHTHQPPRRSCFAVPLSNWRTPCVQPGTENIIASRDSTSRPPPNAKNVMLVSLLPNDRDSGVILPWCRPFDPPTLRSQVIFDDLRVVDGPYAQRFTPTARAFAASATTFLSAHAQTALCAPSRASFLSGRRPDLTRVHWTDAHLRQWGPARAWYTLPQHFRENGYHVAAAGKLFHKMSDSASLDPQSWSEPECVSSYPYYGQGACPEEPDVLLRVFNTSVGCPVDAARQPKYAFTDKQVLHKAITFLRNAAPAARNRERPFWLGVGFFKPHKPFVFPAELLRRVPRLHETELPTNREPPARMPPMAILPELCTARGPATPEAQPGSRCARENVRMYHAAAAFTDGLLGKLLEELEQQRLHDDTLTVMMSDHGFALGEHGAWAKWSNWEVATRVPFAVRAPWLPHSVGQRVTTVVELVDLFPTLAELAGVPLPRPSGSAPVAGYAGIAGRSLAALVEGPHNSSDGAAFSQIARCWPAGAPHNASSFAAMAQCDGVPPSGYAFFGYSIRTTAARLTEWVPTRWDAATSRHMPQWDAVVGTELYEHDEADDALDGWSQRAENDNLAEVRPAEVQSLRNRLRAHVQRTLAEAAAGVPAAVVRRGLS
jgi:iduronate 2-sulfatase